MLGIFLLIYFIDYLRLLCYVKFFIEKQQRLHHHHGYFRADRRDSYVVGSTLTPCAAFGSGRANRNYGHRPAGRMTIRKNRYCHKLTSDDESSISLTLSASSFPE